MAKTIETRIIRDENRFWKEQIRFLPLDDWEPNDGWGTTYISSIAPEDWPKIRG